GDQVPSATCVDTSTLRTYHAECQADACSYPYTDTTCSHGCSGNACVCTVFPQSGCSGAKPACDLVPPNDTSTGCRAVTAPGTTLTPCPAATACAAGYSCIQGSMTNQTACFAFCAHDSDCPTGTRCMGDFTNSTGAFVAGHFCSQVCDVDDDAGCPAGFTCRPLQGNAPQDTGDFTLCDFVGQYA